MIAAKKLLNKDLNLDVENDPKISVNEKSVLEAKSKYKINNNKKIFYLA